MPENNDYLTTQLITYIGNKRKLLTYIESVVISIQQEINKKKLNCLDGFSGSGIVSRMLKQYSKTLYVNDLENYSYVLNKCYLKNVNSNKLKEIVKNINYLNSIKNKVPQEPGIIERLYAPKETYNIKKGERVFYTTENARRIDNIRKSIDLFEEEKEYYLGPLLYKSSVHTNTSGVFKGFYKKKGVDLGQFGGENKHCLERITGEISLPIPVFSKFNCEVNILNRDINNLISDLTDLDIAYYDPPYNQHPYGSNYFMLNLIVDYKEPQELSLNSGIPKNWNKSGYNKIAESKLLIEDLFKNTNSKFILLSYSNEGFVPIPDIIKISEKYGKTTSIEIPHIKFRGGRNRDQQNNHVKEYIIILKK